MGLGILPSRFAVLAAYAIPLTESLSADLGFLCSNLGLSSFLFKRFFWSLKCFYKLVLIMPLPFSLVCDLLEQAHKLSTARKSNAQVVTSWFVRSRGRINAHDTDLAALLSTLLPEKRTDRVYCIQAATLEKIIGRAFLLGSSRIAELAVYKQPGLGVDLGDCVARLLTITVSTGR